MVSDRNCWSDDVKGGGRIDSHGTGPRKRDDRTHGDATRRLDRLGHDVGSVRRPGILLRRIRTVASLRRESDKGVVGVRRSVKYRVDSFSRTCKLFRWMFCSKRLRTDPTRDTMLYIHTHTHSHTILHEMVYTSSLPFPLTLWN